MYEMKESMALMAAWIKKGLKIDRVKENSSMILSHAIGRERLHEVCANGAAIVGKFGDSDEAYRRFKEVVPCASADNALTEIAKLLEVPERLVAWVDREHSNGILALYIAGKLEKMAAGILPCPNPEI